MLRAPGCPFLFMTATLLGILSSASWAFLICHSHQLCWILYDPLGVVKEAQFLFFTIKQDL